MAADFIFVLGEEKSWMCMKCMETELSGGVGWDFRKMAAQLMKWSGAALMDDGGKGGGGEDEERKAWKKNRRVGG
jgi:hypothetical protein